VPVGMSWMWTLACGDARGCNDAETPDPHATSGRRALQRLA